MNDSANSAMNADHESIAIGALSWIASDGELMTRFLGLTGIEPDQIRDVAAEPGFLAAVLDFLLAHEPTLNRFCEDNGLEPKFVARARQRFGDQFVPGPGDYTG
ncbi:MULTISPECIES: DUF3572 domain-containing protein [Ahrensia]|jgi:hypothetical protein|uniref:DUF3572 domain-containing protein n=1 Tax=Ahrensia kielensis TaxID=76980 RepID=A0ABU9T3L7_9HYPH|nr:MULTISPECIES: DUF3572 domain-containing protein [Ahrensia]